VSGGEAFDVTLSSTRDGISASPGLERSLLASLGVAESEASFDPPSVGLVPSGPPSDAVLELEQASAPEATRRRAHDLASDIRVLMLREYTPARARCTIFQVDPRIDRALYAGPFST
jgi:hypothetical protein